jgi:hypothetical protein
MNPTEVVKAIEYVLNSIVNIPIIGIEKIVDNEMVEQLSKKGK